MKKLFLLLLSVLISTQTFAASSALNFGTLGVSGRGMSGSDTKNCSELGITISPQNFGTIGSTDYKCRRTGDILEVNIHFQVGASPAASTASIDLSGVTIDVAKIGSETHGYRRGTWMRPDSGVNISSGDREGPVFFDGSDNNSLFFAYQSNSSGLIKETGSGLYDANKYADIQFTVPIVGWIAGGDGASSAEVAAARHGDDCVFTNADAGGISDFATDASCTFTSRIASGITLSALLDGGSQDYPGVKFTPTVSGAYYEICARTTIQSGGGAGSTVQMYDGSGALMAQSFTQATYTIMPFCGIYLSVGTSEVGFRLRAYTNTGTTTISGLSLNESGIEWIVKRIK